MWLHILCFSPSHWWSLAGDFHPPCWLSRPVRRLNCTKAYFICVFYTWPLVILSFFVLIYQSPVIIWVRCASSLLIICQLIPVQSCLGFLSKWVKTRHFFFNSYFRMSLIYQLTHRPTAVFLKHCLLCCFSGAQGKIAPTPTPTVGQGRGGTGTRKEARRKTLGRRKMSTRIGLVNRSHHCKSEMIEAKLINWNLLVDASRT